MNSGHGGAVNARPQRGNSVHTNNGALLSHKKSETIPSATTCMGREASLVAQTVKNPPAMQETWVRSLVGKTPPRDDHTKLSKSDRKTTNI